MKDKFSNKETKCLCNFGHISFYNPLTKFKSPKIYIINLWEGNVKYEGDSDKIWDKNICLSYDKKEQNRLTAVKFWQLA